MFEDRLVYMVTLVVRNDGTELVTLCHNDRELVDLLQDYDKSTYLIGPVVPVDNFYEDFKAFVKGNPDLELG